MPTVAQSAGKRAARAILVTLVAAVVAMVMTVETPACWARWITSGRSSRNRSSSRCAWVSISSKGKASSLLHDSGPLSNLGCPAFAAPSADPRKQRLHFPLFQRRQHAQVLRLPWMHPHVLAAHFFPRLREVEAAVDRLRRARQERLQQDCRRPELLRHVV